MRKLPLLVLLLLSASDSRTPEWRPEGGGFVLAHVHDRGVGYGSGISGELYRRNRSYDYRLVQFNTFAYQPDLSSTRLTWNDATLTLEDLKREIRSARRSGFRVMLKPHVWVGGFPPRQWRNAIDPRGKSLDEWFNSYAVFLLEQCGAAESAGASDFVVGTELVRLSANETHWRHLISRLRRECAGMRLGYADEAWHAAEIRFWDALDFIGVNFYFGTPETEDNAVMNFFRKKIDAMLAIGLQSGKPVIFTEAGFPSHDLAIRKPHAWPDAQRRADLPLQKRAYHLFSRALQDGRRPAAIFFWKYVTSLNSYEAREHEKGFSLAGKPAEAEIRSINRLLAPGKDK